jgi:hypothetical protein
MKRRSARAIRRKFYDHHGAKFKFSIYDKVLKNLESSFDEHLTIEDQIKHVNRLVDLVLIEQSQWRDILNRIASGKQFATENYLENAKNQLEIICGIETNLISLRNEIENK